MVTNFSMQYIFVTFCYLKYNIENEIYNYEMLVYNCEKPCNIKIFKIKHCYKKYNNNNNSYIMT